MILKKTGREISEKIQAVLQDRGIPLEDCRGQGYDNGAKISGKVKGVQAQILKQNLLATYTPVLPIPSQFGGCSPCSVMPRGLNIVWQC
jgi:predicted esterase